MVTTFPTPPQRSTAKETLFALAQGCDACEISWSIHDGGVEERILFFFDHQDDSALMLARAAVALGYPAGLLQGWSQALPMADAIGLAVSRDLRSVRLYVQYWETVRARVIDGDLTPAPLYVGFKALASGQVRTDTYVCLPAAPRGMVWPPMRQALCDFGADAAAVDTAFAPLTDGNCIHTEILSDRRRSWLDTVRRAPFDAQAMAAALRPVAQRAGSETLVTALTNNAPLVHVAGGEDDAKGRFLTLYLEADPEQAVASITRPDH